jgi:hypothetical protein
MVVGIAGDNDSTASVYDSVHSHSDSNYSNSYLLTDQVTRLISFTVHYTVRNYCLSLDVSKITVL